MNTSQQRRYFDWHKTAGFSTAIFLLIVAISGLSFGYMSYMKSLVSIFSEVDAIHHQEPKLLKSTALNTQSITLDQAVKVADRVFPDAITRWVATPEGRDGVYAIEKRQPGEANQRRPRSKIWLDQYSGQVLKKEDPKNFTAGETLLNLMWPLHSGEALGLPGRILWCILGFSPLLLYITGLLRWQQKRRSAEFSLRRKAKMSAIRND